MTYSLVNPSINRLVNAGVIVSGSNFFRDWGEGGVLPVEKEEALICAELSDACGLLEDDDGYGWEKIDEIEISLGEDAKSLQKKLEEEDAFLEAMDSWMFDPKEIEEQPHPNMDISSPGYKMMKAMGWKDNTPLGCRDRGILEPVSTMIKVRLAGDLSGIGYEKKEKQLVEGEKDTLDVKVIRVEKNFAVGDCSRGKVYIPRGPMKHLINLCDRNIVGVCFSAEVMAKQGRYEWRVISVVDLA